MLLRSLVATFAFTAFAALAAACTASEPGPSTPGGDDITQTGSSSKGCLVGATKNDEGGFCVQLPEGTSTTAASKGSDRFEYTTANGNVLITVRPGDKAAFDAAKAQITSKATGFGGYAKSNDTTLSSVWREQANTGPRSTVTMVFDGAKIYECSVTSANAPTLTVCQTLRAQ